MAPTPRSSTARRSGPTTAARSLGQARGRTATKLATAETVITAALLARLVPDPEDPNYLHDPESINGDAYTAYEYGKRYPYPPPRDPTTNQVLKVSPFVLRKLPPPHTREQKRGLLIKIARQRTSASIPKRVRKLTSREGTHCALTRLRLEAKLGRRLNLGEQARHLNNSWQDLRFSNLAAGCFALNIADNFTDAELATSLSVTASFECVRRLSHIQAMYTRHGLDYFQRSTTPRRLSWDNAVTATRMQEVHPDTGETLFVHPCDANMAVTAGTATKSSRVYTRYILNRCKGKCGPWRELLPVFYTSQRGKRRDNTMLILPSHFVKTAWNSRWSNTGAHYFAKVVIECKQHRLVDSNVDQICHGVNGWQFNSFDNLRTAHPIANAIDDLELGDRQSYPEYVKQLRARLLRVAS